ncbi:MAG: hypothetical protein V3S14_12595 [Anaerolineae bacterium]
MSKRRTAGAVQHDAGGYRYGGAPSADAHAVPGGLPNADIYANANALRRALPHGDGHPNYRAHQAAVSRRYRR